MRFVAVGDSFTEGVGDELDDGTVRGWADLVAEGLGQVNGDVEYANLAIRGRLLTSIATEQLDQALAMDPAPTFMTFNGGGNDILRTGFSVPALLALTHRSIRAVLDAGIELLVLAGPDPTDQLPFGKVVRGRARHLTSGLSQLVQDLPVTYVNVFADNEIRRRGYWSEDRLHLGPAGHRRVAGLVLQALGHDVEPFTLDPAPTSRRGLDEQARYYRAHVAPWFGRRIRRASSGDGVTAKHADWVPVSVADHRDA